MPETETKISMNFRGPHSLTFDKVTGLIGEGLPGVFALGYIGDKQIFYVNYVGRADRDLRARLLQYIGSDAAFKFEVTDSAKAAFLRECELFHAFHPRGNIVHPGRPAVSDWRCPHCSILGSRSVS